MMMMTMIMMLMMHMMIVSCVLNRYQFLRLRGFLHNVTCFAPPRIFTFRPRLPNG